MEIARIASPFPEDDKPYHQKAREVLPILVRQAMVAEKMYYGHLAEEIGIPNPRNLNYPLGSIGNALIDLGEKWGTSIPPIECIVVNKSSELPGDGIGVLLDSDFKKKNKRQKKIIAKQALSEVFVFDRWHEVLKAFDLEPFLVNITIKDISKKAGTYGGGGESESHKKLKHLIENNPKLVKVPQKIYQSETEYRFPSGDEIDISIELPRQWVGVEVKSEISADEDVLRGLYQCVKYQALMEAHLSVVNQNKDVRVVLALGAEFPAELIPVRNILGIEVIANISC